jgi:hypothetical protein
VFEHAIATVGGPDSAALASEAFQLFLADATRSLLHALYPGRLARRHQLGALTNGTPTSIHLDRFFRFAFPADVGATKPSEMFRALLHTTSRPSMIHVGDNPSTTFAAPPTGHLRSGSTSRQQFRAPPARRAVSD